MRVAGSRIMLGQLHRFALFVRALFDFIETYLFLCRY